MICDNSVVTNKRIEYTGSHGIKKAQNKGSILFCTFISLYAIIRKRADARVGHQPSGW